VALNAAPPRLWKRLADTIGTPELKDPALVPLARRLERQDWLDAQVAAWVARHGVDEVLALTGKAGVPCARVAEKLEDLVDDPSTIARGLLQPLEHPTCGVMAGLHAPGVPIASPGVTNPPLTRAPKLGEHTHQILVRDLGLTESQIRDLESRNIV
jgi:crotonobetainyl-CoA:carnitine CoA-transferase CaiB-like acyl-CoA transferase